MVTKAEFAWNGVAVDGGGNFTLQPGVQPSTAVLRFTMGSKFNQIGQLRLSNGNQAISFNRCRVVQILVNQSGGAGRWREVTIEDRRWMWADSYFPVYGEYNRVSTPRAAAKNKKSAYELVILLLNALGETGYSISGVPTNQYPTVSWDAASPAAELENLLQQYGCGVSLVPGDFVRVFKIGQGVEPNLNDPRAMDYQITAAPKIVPGNLVLDGGAMHVHHDLPLRAVAPKSNYSEEYLPIDQVSYVPAGGWKKTRGIFNNVDKVYRKLAEDNVYKAYEICQGFAGAANQQVASSIKLPIPPTIQFSKGGQLSQAQNVQKLLTVDNSSIHRLLPLNEKRYNMSGSLASDTEIRVYGYYWKGGQANRNATNVPGALISTYADAEAQLPLMADSSVMPLADPLPASELVIADSFRDKIDLQNGRVFFNQQLMFRDAAGDSFEAWLRLRCSFPVRDPETMAFLTSQYWYNPNNPIEVQISKVIKNSEIFLEYSANGQSNITEFVAAAYGAIASDYSQIAHSSGYSIPYNTWVFDIAPDGIVKAIVWDHAESGEGTTHIDYNIERPSYYETLTERRLRRLYTYNAQLDLELKRKARRGVVQTRFGGARP